MCGITSWENKEFMSDIAPRIHSRKLSLNWNAVQPEGWSAELLDQLDICIPHWRPVHDPKFMSWTWRGLQRVLDLGRILKNRAKILEDQNYCRTIWELIQNVKNFLNYFRTSRTTWELTSKLLELQEPQESQK